ncbi:HNH endonuclease [Streptomyces orinoci]|uniref:HNH endonuclease n=1 Tax=Streptomyces orinoci TaxID=67339 RepID=A0ABV3K7C3_STRON|nr:HNH endonuclease [Streptomyces orinoci]
MSEGLDWRDETLGARVRVALWLRDEVGEKGTFSKQQLRQAIHGTEQVDRRMRDLRPAGWVIKTYRDKSGLLPDQLYLETIGKPVWEHEHRNAGLRQISARIRREVFERDGHVCRRCGITAGELYAEEPRTPARLTLGHVISHKAGGTARAEDLITECARCNEAVRHLTGVQMGKEQVWDRIENLSKNDRKSLLAWMVHNGRPQNPAEKAWALYWQLPAAHRDELKGRLYDLLQD